MQVSLAWASWASVPFIGGSVSPARRALAVFPLLLLYTAKGSGGGLGELIQSAGAQNRQNIVFLCHLLLGNLNACVDLLIASSRIPEAAFFARTYVPSRMTEVR